MAEALTLPLLLLRRDGVLLNANMAGVRELARGSLLRRDGERVVPASAAQHEAFTLLLEQVATARERLVWSGGTAPPHEPIVIAPVMADRSLATTLLMVVMPAEASMADSCRLFAYQYGLSPGELGVLYALCQGHAPRDIAHKRGVSVSTVRTQLARVRRKCGESRMHTLVPRLGALPPVWALEPKPRVEGE